MRTIEMNEASSPLADYVAKLEAGGIVVTRQGRPRAALVPLSADTDLESFGLSTNPHFIRLLEKSRRQVKQGRKASLAEMKKEFGSP